MDNVNPVFLKKSQFYVKPRKKKNSKKKKFEGALIPNSSKYHPSTDSSVVRHLNLIVPTRDLMLEVLLLDH